MKDATFSQAKAIAQQHGLDSKQVWKMIRGVRYSDARELASLVLTTSGSRGNVRTSTTLHTNTTQKRLPKSGSSN